MSAEKNSNNRRKITGTCPMARNVSLPTHYFLRRNGKLAACPTLGIQLSKSAAAWATHSADRGTLLSHRDPWRFEYAVGEEGFDELAGDRAGGFATGACV